MTDNLTEQSLRETLQLNEPKATLLTHAERNRLLAHCRAQAEQIAALEAERDRLREQWNTRFNILCGNCGRRFRGPRDDDQHGSGICSVPALLPATAKEGADEPASSL